MNKTKKSDEFKLFGFNIQELSRRGTDQYAPIDLTLWYIAKTIPTLLE